MISQEGYGMEVRAISHYYWINRYVNKEIVGKVPEKRLN